jgi:hypothetical protein
VVDIHYLRLPDRRRVYRQELLLDGAGVKVSFQPDTPVAGPLELDGLTVVEPGSPVVWFTFPGLWHDIGRFHTLDGRFTGLYANILTPPRFALGPGGTSRWDTTDLFLDVWLPPGGPPRVLDRDQFDEAREHGWLDDETAERALAEVDALLAACRNGSWPPPVVAEWTLERARKARGTGGP